MGLPGTRRAWLPPLQPLDQGPVLAPQQQQGQCLPAEASSVEKQSAILAARNLLPVIDGWCHVIGQDAGSPAHRLYGAELDHRDQQP